jgi:hypothetical protein
MVKDFPLIEELTSAESNLQIFEAKNDKGEKVYKCRGRFQMAEAENRNKRIYPKHILEREVKRLAPKVEERSLFIELDHPKDRVSTELKTTCAVVTELVMEGNEVIGEYEVLPTDPHGKNLQIMLERKCKPGISSRGSGQLIRKDGKMYVSESYRMKTFDIVSDESTIGAKPSLVEGQVIDVDELNESLLTSEFVNEDVKERINNLFELGKLNAIGKLLISEFNLEGDLKERVSNLLEIERFNEAMEIIEKEGCKKKKKEVKEALKDGTKPDGTGPHGKGMGPGKGKKDGSGMSKKNKKDKKYEEESTKDVLEAVDEFLAEEDEKEEVTNEQYYHQFLAGFKN